VEKPAVEPSVRTSDTVRLDKSSENLVKFSENQHLMFGGGLVPMRFKLDIQIKIIVQHISAFIADHVADLRSLNCLFVQFLFYLCTIT
jgi:hypothetical protein